MPDRKISREDAEEIWYSILAGVRNGAIPVEDPQDAVDELVAAYWNLQSVTGESYRTTPFSKTVEEPQKLLERPSVIRERWEQKNGRRSD